VGLCLCSYSTYKSRTAGRCREHNDHNSSMVLDCLLTWTCRLQTVAAQAGLVKNRVVKNRKGLFRIRHLQESDLLPVAQLQVSGR